MNILIDLLVFSLPLGVITRITLLPNVQIYLHDLIVSFILLFFCVELFKRKTVIINKEILRSFILFVGVCFVSLIINYKFLIPQTFLISLLYLIRYVAYFSLLFVVGSRDARFIRSLNYKLVISGLIFTAFGYLQYFFYSNLRNLYYAGWDDHLYRLFSTMLDPNFAGIFLVLTFLLIFANFISVLDNNQKKSAIFFGFSSIFTLVAIYLTYSRSAFLSLGVGIIVFLIIKGKAKILLPLIALLVLMLALFSNTKIEGLNPFRITSSEARLDSARVAISIIEKNPVLGIGFNAYRYAQIRYGFRREVLATPSNADAGTDNSYLFVLVTSGIIGFFIFIKLITQIILSLRKNAAKIAILSPISLPSFCSVLVNAIFINSLFYLPVMIWLFILIGATVSRKR